MGSETANLFTALAAAAAALGFLYTIYRGRADARRSREISARIAWEKYLELAFEHPRLANRELPRDPSLPAGEDHEKYEWFVARMLYAAEEVLLCVDAGSEWEGVILDQIELHKPYLANPDEEGGGNQYLGGYLPQLQQLFRDAGLNVPKLEKRRQSSLSGAGSAPEAAG